jgi:hypothetical protein
MNGCGSRTAFAAARSANTGVAFRLGEAIFGSHLFTPSFGRCGALGALLLLSHLILVLVRRF